VNHVRFKRMSDNRAIPTRRQILLGAGASGALVVLAACSSDSDTPAAGSTAPAPSPDSSESAAATTAPSPSADATSAAPAADAVIALDKVPVGGSVAATVAGAPVIVAQPTKGKVVCFSAICTHQGAQTSTDGKVISCPRHGSLFNAFTGAVEGGPATKPLPAVKVKIDGTNVVAG
jgi:nitrite reductase/ring-hydroxylating ferredoxin subunit